MPHKWILPLEQCYFQDFYMDMHHIPPHTKPAAAADLERIRKYTSWLDNRFRLPGTRFRFGLDPVIGLIPVVGDITSLAFQGMLFSLMIKHGASGKVRILMLLNILVDFILGSIPFLGAVLDFVYKSNEKNYNLLMRHYREGRHQGSGTGLVVLFVLLAILLAAVIGWLVYKFIAFIIALF